MKDFKSLYGLKIPSSLHGELKIVADVLAKQTYTNVPLRVARRKATEIALRAFVQMREWDRVTSFVKMAKGKRGGK